jgi:poly(A) polymerase
MQTCFLLRSVFAAPLALRKSHLRCWLLARNIEGVAVLSESTHKPPCSREDALAVLRRLHDAGHVTYFAGGCVRDLLLGIEPKDYDVATDAPPDRVRQLFARTQAVGAAFGVVLVRQGASVVEVATFRSDGEYLDGRRPTSVRFTRAEEDAQRRDFTINGLFLDPITDRVVDFVGGRADVKARLIRAIGDPRQRFAEDHLRLLRAVRFAARLSFEIEPATAAAIRAEAPQLKRITPERIAEELRLMLPPTTRVAAWELLWELALVGQVFRHLGAAPGEMPAAERSIFRNLAPGEPVSFGLSLAGAVLCFQHALAPQEDVRRLLVKSAVQRTVRMLRPGLRLSNAELDEVDGSLMNIATVLEHAPPRLSRRKRFLATTTAANSMRLMEAMAAAGWHRDLIASRLEELRPLVGTEVAPAPLLVGDDLTALGWAPGPTFKRVLEAVYDAQLEGEIATKEGAILMARRIERGV